MNPIVKADINQFADDFRYAEEFRGATVLVTGATGFIGSMTIRCLLALERDIRIIGLVRSKSKALSIFGDDENIEWIEQPIERPVEIARSVQIDYIIHCAAPTNSKFMHEHPVEVVESIVAGTSNILRLAREHGVKGMVFLSSLEVYGLNLDDKWIEEDFSGYVDPLLARSSYPVAKRLTENLCCDYAQEYNLNVMIARLTQTVGAGVSPDDNRAFMAFARSASRGETIVLKTKGGSKKPYIYITDAVAAILTLLIKGKSQNAYNIARDDSYISIYELTTKMGTKVEFDHHGSEIYPPETMLKLSSKKISSLGWEAKVGLDSMIAHQISYYKSLS